MSFSRGPNIVTDGLILAIDAGSTRSYPGSGTTWTSLIDKSDTGTLLSGASFDNSVGGNFVFDGADDYATLPSNLQSKLSGSDEASLEMWVKTDQIDGGAGTSGLIQLSSYTETNGNLYFYSSGTYLDTFRTTRWTAGDFYITKGFNPTFWHHFVITSKLGAGGYRIFFNSELFNSTTGNIITVDSSIHGGFTFGENSGGRNLDGNIAITRIYDRALTDAEVLQNYNSQKTRFSI